jgi:mannitol-specific phosphotransferase system IIBC component
MNEVLHWLLVGFLFGTGFAAGHAVCAAIIHLLGGRGK